jgi:ubiquinone/menaquinone biosynthesis C-methylase UbiE
MKQATNKIFMGATGLLINPYNKQPLTINLTKEKCFLTDLSGNEIPVIDGIPNFLALENTNGLNKTFQEFYDRASKMNMAWMITSFLENTLVHKQRKEWMKNIEVCDGWKVLETSIGSGWNTGTLTADAEYFGLDITRGMLSRCQRNNKRWGKNVNLFQGNAEHLPFKDETFDCVFQIGGINFFNDRKKAIEEMIRVAKPNAKIVIMDETEKTIKTYYERTPILRKILKQNHIEHDRMIAPVELVPESMNEVASELTFNDMMYVLSFRKPNK